MFLVREGRMSITRRLKAQQGFDLLTQQQRAVLLHLALGREANEAIRAAYSCTNDNAVASIRSRLKKNPKMAAIALWLQKELEAEKRRIEEVHVEMLRRNAPVEAGFLEMGEVERAELAHQKLAERAYFHGQPQTAGISKETWDYYPDPPAGDRSQRAMHVREYIKRYRAWMNDEQPQRWQQMKQDHRGNWIPVGQQV
jgi:hypothetical protein